MNDVDKCDIFGKTCFLRMVDNIVHDSRNLCPQCIDECDKTVYSKTSIKSENITLPELSNYDSTTVSCNKYICGDETK